ncbi:MAG: hypothetical protein GC161_08640 [Planctomycetaceae bacterium]|nr:hypothetical protein [Planctomycetaceae bacterium]
MGSRTKRVGPLVLGVVALLAAVLALVLTALVPTDSGEETTEANPTFEAPEAAPGLVGLGPAAPPTVGRSAEATSIPPRGTSVSEAARGTTLVVLDESGARVAADVVVRAFDLEQCFSVEASAEPAALSLDRFPVRIEARNAAAAGELVLLGKPANPALALTVRPLGEWTGVVVDATGQPVNAGVRVAVLDRRYSAESEPVAVGWTDDDGRFVVQGLPPDAPVLAYVGGAGYIGRLDGDPVTLGGEGARIEVEYLFGVAIDGSSYSSGGGACSISKRLGLVMPGTAPGLDPVPAAHPGIAHMAEAWNLFDPSPFRQVFLISQERAYPLPSVRVGVQWRGRSWDLEEAPMQRALEQIVSVRLNPPAREDEEAPRNASLELQFAPPAGIERLTSNRIVGEVVFLYEELGLESFPLRRDDLLQRLVLTCLPEGPARFSVNLAGGAAPQTPEGTSTHRVVLSNQRTIQLVDLSHLRTLEIEAVDPEFGPVLGTLSLAMGRGEVSSTQIARSESSIRERFAGPPYLVFGLSAGGYWITVKSPEGQSRPIDLQIPSGGGTSSVVVELIAKQ